MARINKKFLFDIFLSVEIDSNPNSPGTSSAQKIWRQFQPELIGINSQVRRALNNSFDEHLHDHQYSTLDCIAQSKKLLTTKEVAVLIGKSEGSVRNLVSDGRLTPASKKWNTNYFDKDEVLKTIRTASERDS